MKKLFLWGCAGCGCLIFILIVLLLIGAAWIFATYHGEPPQLSININSTAPASNRNMPSD